MSGFTTRGQWALTGRDSRRIVSSLDEDGADNSRSNKSSMNVSCSNMNMHYSGRAYLSALHMHIRVRVRVIWGGTRFELMLLLHSRFLGYGDAGRAGRFEGQVLLCTFLLMPGQFAPAP